MSYLLCVCCNLFLPEIHPTLEISSCRASLIVFQGRICACFLQSPRICLNVYMLHCLRGSYMWTAAMDSFFSYTVKVSMIKTRKLFKTPVPSFQMFVSMFVSWFPYTLNARENQLKQENLSVFSLFSSF